VDQKIWRINFIRCVIFFPSLLCVKMLEIFERNATYMSDAESRCCCKTVTISIPPGGAANPNPKGVVNFDKTTGKWTWEVTYNIEIAWTTDHTGGGLVISYETQDVTVRYRIAAATATVAAQYQEIKPISVDVSPPSPFAPESCARPHKLDVTLTVTAEIDATARHVIEDFSKLTPPVKTRFVVDGHLKAEGNPACPGVKKQANIASQDLSFSQDLTWKVGPPAGPSV